MWIEGFSTTLCSIDHAALGFVSHVLYRKAGGTKCPLWVGVSLIIFTWSNEWRTAWCWNLMARVRFALSVA